MLAVFDNLEKGSIVDVEGNKTLLGGINPKWYLENGGGEAANSYTVNNRDLRFYAVDNVKAITTQANLAAISSGLSNKYILLNDIPLNANGAGFESDKGWIPIGNDSNHFEGIFNGNGHKITNFWTNRPSDMIIGFFGYTENAQIKNLGIEIAEGREVKGRGGASNGGIGGIVGDARNSTIQNSYVIGNIRGTGSYIGGIAGYLSVSSVNINDGSIIQNSYFVGNVSGGTTDVVNCCVGGIAGRAHRSIIRNNAVLGVSVTGLGSNNNRVLGYSSYSTTSNNFALDTMTVNSATVTGNAGNENGADKTESELKQQAAYESLGWKFGDNDTNPWSIDENVSYPYFYREKL